MVSLSASKEALAREARSPSNVKGLAKKASEEGKVVFYCPEEGVPINSPATLYYNSAPSPLPGPPPSPLFPLLGLYASEDRKPLSSL